MNLRKVEDTLEILSWTFTIIIVFVSIKEGLSNASLGLNIIYFFIVNVYFMLRLYQRITEKRKILI